MKQTLFEIAEKLKSLGDQVKDIAEMKESEQYEGIAELLNKMKETSQQLESVRTDIGWNLHPEIDEQTTLFDDEFAGLVGSKFGKLQLNSVRRENDVVYAVCTCYCDIAFGESHTFYCYLDDILDGRITKCNYCDNKCVISWDSDLKPHIATMSSKMKAYYDSMEDPEEKLKYAIMSFCAKRRIPCGSQFERIILSDAGVLVTPELFARISQEI